MDSGSIRAAAVPVQIKIAHAGICFCYLARRNKQPGHKYYACGQKSGLTTNKDTAAMTQFNYDNYAYPPDNPSVPLYISVPLLVEVCA